MMQFLGIFGKKVLRSTLWGVTLLGSLILVGCGGGGSGGTGVTGGFNNGASLSLSPTDVKAPAGIPITFYIAGGTAPYRVNTGFPDLFPPPERINPDGSFVITPPESMFSGLGGAKVDITVLDAKGASAKTTVEIQGRRNGPVGIFPNEVKLYPNTPFRFELAGGYAPFRVASSDPAVLPVPGVVANSVFPVVPNNVDKDTDVVLTVVDSSGTGTQAKVTVRPGPLVNNLSVTPTAVDAQCTPAVCSGEYATASVSLRNLQGGPLPGRPVRFDVVEGEFRFTTANPNQPYVTSITVDSDQSGVALARLMANVNAPTQTALIRATDLGTGYSRTVSFTIAQRVDAGTSLRLVPSSLKLTGWFDDSCTFGVNSTFYIFGGTPPYRVQSSGTNLFTLAGGQIVTVVQTNGGAFTTTSSGALCGEGTILVTDATGRTTTGTYTNEFGKNKRTDRIVSPFTVFPQELTMDCNKSAQVSIAGGVSKNYTIEVPDARIMGLISGENATITVMKKAAVNTGDATTKVNISDGTNTVPVKVNLPTNGCSS